MATIDRKQNITSCLCFKGNAEEAVDFYISVFKDSEKGRVARWGKGMPEAEGSVLTVEFKLQGMEFLALNGGPDHHFTDAVSFMVNCDTQDEIDYYWDALADGGEHSVCGWLKDRFGLSWQVAPRIIGELLTDADQEKSTRVIQEVMKMTKLDIDILTRAFDGKLAV